MPSSGAFRGATAVLLVDERPAYGSVLADDLRSIGLEVTRAASMAQAMKEPAWRPVDLLLLNVDRIDEPSWLRAAEYRRAHPGVHVWAYTSWSSPVDVTLANFVPVDELIYYDGSPGDLADKIAFRTASCGRPTAVVAGVEQGTEVSVAVA